MEHDLEQSESTGATIEASREGAVLAMLHDRSAPADAPLAIRGAQVTIGSDPESDVVLGGPQVARRHAQLRLRGGFWTLVDFGSPGGSMVDGDQVRGEALLAPGSSVRLGEMLFAFAPQDRWQDSPPERRAGDRTPLLVVPERNRSIGPWVIFGLVAAAALVAVVFLLLRSS